MIPRDTDKEAHQIQMDLFRQLGGAGRVALAVQMSEQALEISRQGIRDRHPQYSAQQVHQALCRMSWGETLYREVWPENELLE